MPMHRLSAIVVVVVALLAAACTTDPDDTTSEAGEEPAGTTGSVPASEARGVTDTEIKLGVGYIDASEFGFNSGDLEAQWQTAIDTVNDAGGINGRVLVPVYQSYSPVGSTEAEAACLVFTEDEEVFAFVGFVREGNELCYTDNGTIAVNTEVATTESVERSDGLLFTADATKLGRELLAVEAAAAEGLIDGRRVHINAQPVDEPLIEPVREAIEAAGGEVISTAVQETPSGDVPAAQAEHDIIIERVTADGGDTVYAIADIALATTGAVQRANADLTVVTTHSNGPTYLNFGTDPAGLDLHVYAPEPFEALYERGEGGVVECVERYEAATGNTVNIGEIDPDPNNFPATVRACRGIDVFATLAAAAGDELTTESFLAAAAALGPMELTGATAASMTEGKVGADDSPFVALDWDAASESFVPAS